MGISAWHLLRRSNTEFFKRSFAMAATFAFVSSLVLLVQGHQNGAYVAEHQPSKLAAMESHWTTTGHAPQYLFLIPDEANERNAVELLPIPSGLSMLAFHSPSAVVKGLKDFPKEDRPPVALTFVAFRIMIGLGFLFPVLAGYAWYKRGDITAYPKFLRLLVWAIPLPFVAIEAGWAVTEVGRQPWIVYGLMRTKDAVSQLSVGQVSFSLIMLVLIYTMLVSLAMFLAFRLAKQGPMGGVTASTHEGGR
jgi:cytochrome d ubiquinol oxidase subunit I